MSDQTVGFVKLYHPSGALVTIPLSPDYGDEASAIEMGRLFRAVNDAMAAGFLVNPPGLSEGEQKVVCQYAVRREQDSDGEITPVIDLYAAEDGMNTYKFLKVYLNTDDDITAFERATGLTLSKMPKYIGSGDIERGKNRQLDQFVCRSNAPFTVVWKVNPKYDPEAAKAATQQKPYLVAKKKFVRWDGTAAAPKAQTGKVLDYPADRFAEDIKLLDRFLANDPAVQDVTDRVNAARKTKGLVAALWPTIARWMSMTGCEWDRDNNCFVPPKEPDPDDTDGDQGKEDPPY